MKSINEFATEYAQDKYMPVQTSQAVKAGANYALDAIIECLPKTHSFNPNEVIDIITSRIKELKK